MEVTQIAKHVTHAVIGKHAAMESGISESAEFYQMLSQSLYRNPKLAMIREVICNQLDAHTMGNVTMPPDITITDDRVVFRDYGPGIPHDKVHEIYNVYGNSTKKKDKNQTGGFGLGCKSPYAYTDHFTVISYNNGIKSVYQMAKSSGEVQGKPSMTLLVQTPTTETGLEVSIDIHSKQDYVELFSYIRGVCRNSGKSVRVNGDIIPHIDFSSATKSFLLCRDLFVMDSNITVHLKYGDVVYPVTEDKSYFAALNACDQIVKSINSSNGEADRFTRLEQNSLRLVLLMEPGTITIAPSRENITLDPYTCNTIKEKLEAFLHDFDTETKKFRKELVIENYTNYTNMIRDRYIGKAFKPNRNEIYWNLFNSFPSLKYLEYRSDKPITSSKDMASLFATKSFPTALYKSLHRKMVADTISQFCHPLARGLIYKASKNDILGLRKGNSEFIIDSLIPVVARKLGYENIRVFASSIGHWQNQHPWNTVRSFCSYQNRWMSDDDVKDLLNMVVFYGRENKNTYNRIKTYFHKRFDRRYGPDAFWFVPAPADKKKDAMLRERLDKSGMIVVDLTSLMDYEIAEKEENKRLKEAKAYSGTSSAKPSANKFIPLSAGWYPARGIKFNTIYAKTCNRTKYTLVEDPIMYLRTSFRGNNGQTCIAGVSDSYLQKFIELYGNKCAMVSTEAEETRLVKKGVPTIQSWLQNQYARLMKNNSFRRYLVWKDIEIRRSRVRELMPSSIKDDDIAFPMIMSDKINMLTHHVEDTLKPETKKSFRFEPEDELLFNMLKATLNYNHQVVEFLGAKERNLYRHLVRNIPPKVENFQKKLLENPVLPFIDVKSLISAKAAKDKKAEAIFTQITGIK